MDLIDRKFAALLRRDRRYPVEAYQFVHEALQYATKPAKAVGGSEKFAAPEESEERHVTGQELCEGIRRYATDQYGLMAKIVLNNWGIYQTSDFGEIVYNLIEVNRMRKSDSDRREHFDDVYDFDEAFVHQFRIKSS
jgi:uncharacterized repeat protein (TIGR04138 family)